MKNKMKFMYCCCGAAGVEREITAPEINRVCPKCNHKMQLIDGRGLSNSGTHSFLCECIDCGCKEKFSDYELWKKCMDIAKYEKNNAVVNEVKKNTEK